MASLILSINRRKEGGLTIEETEQQIAILQLDNLDEQLDQQLAAEAVDGFPVPRDDATVMSHITLPSALLQTARKEESIDASDAEETEEHYDSAMLPALRVQFFTKMSEDSSLFETLSEYLSPYAPIPDPIEVRVSSTVVVLTYDVTILLEWLVVSIRGLFVYITVC